MIDSPRRSLVPLFGMAGLAAAAALVGCGKKEEPAPVAATPAPASAPAAKAEPLKIAFAYVGPVGDAGWTFAHDAGRKAVEAEFGDKVKTSYVENVPEAADAERVIRQMVSEGNKLVFGTTFGYMDPMMKVAADTRTSSSSTPPASRLPTTCAPTTAAPTRARTWPASLPAARPRATRWAWSARSRYPRSSATSTASPSARRA
jgi:basic membrane lipoprotein Med (substrate-binding protein (PBP1-ABC) superfamily)